MKLVESKLQVDDWAKDLKLVWSSDKGTGAKTTYASTQWNKFKNGTKNRLYNYSITDPTHNYEYVLKFDLGSVIMLSEIQIGVVYNWSTYDPDCNYEPLSLILEGSHEEEGATEWRVLLDPVQDDGFRMNSITAYAVSFGGLMKTDANATSFESALEKIGSKQAKYLTFRFRKPIMACLD